MTGLRSVRTGPNASLWIAVLGTAFALTAFACGSEDAGNDSTEAGGGGGTVEIKDIVVVATDFQFDRTEIKLDPGAEGEVTFTNDGETEHSFTAEELDIHVEAEGGQTKTTGFEVPDEDATYEFFCEYHPDQMRGTLIVGAGGDAPMGGGGEDTKD